MVRDGSRLRVAMTAGRLAGRRLLGRAATVTDRRLGQALTDELDKMKGLAMKVGQIVSYLDVPLPPDVLRTLTRLQTGTVGMSPTQTREVLGRALHRDVEACFDRFDWTPVAAASIGQVHRAWVGEVPVAVKVQYPGISTSFRDDLRTVERIAGLASLASAVDGTALVTELAARLTEECDYVREARMQQAFAQRFSDDDRISIPRVWDSLSADRVLTTSWVEGDAFEHACAHPDPAWRSDVAQTILRFSYVGLFRDAAIQADPHPGNFLFEPSGRVICLDFGCVRTFERPFVRALADIASAVRADDRSAFERACHALGVVGRPKAFDFDHFFAVMEHLHRPFCRPHFAFTPEFVAQGHRLNGPTSPNARTLRIPPPYLWVLRLQWGLWSILAKLRAEGDFRPVLDRALACDATSAHP